MMERALKERIIGAVVLVVFVVLVVPIFLDGPPEGAQTVSEPVPLPGQESQDTKVVVLNRERSVPIPAASVAGDSGTDEESGAAASNKAADSEPRPIVAGPATAPSSSTVNTTGPAAEEATADEQRRETVTASATASDTGMWAVQLGSFSDMNNAQALAADLRKQGYAAFLSKLDSGGKELHRVRIGPQKDRQSAEAMAARLAKVGHKGQVLPHP